MMARAKAVATKTMGSPVPVWLRNAPTKLMKELGFGEGQKWEAGFHLDKSYLPEDARGQQIFGAKIDYNHNNKS